MAAFGLPGLILPARRRLLAIALAAALSGSLLVDGSLRAESPARPALTESYIEEPLPNGFRVEATELEGPVFADAGGRTLYTWPLKRLRNGYSGESPGKAECYDEVRTVTAGLMSPYPPGVTLPDLDSRPACTDLWPPVIADADAEAVGNWSVVVGRDGRRQWAHNEQPVYTSIRDREPGDTLGGSGRRSEGDSPAVRKPVGPDPDIPPGFAVATTSVGRLLTTAKTYSVYVYDRDTPETSACDDECARTWQPILAPALARALGEWSIVERSAGVRQWSFRGQPLYTYVLDQQAWSQEGSDVPGWSNVYTQRAPQPPDSFTVQDTLIGQVLADPDGMSVYTYICGDDSADQLSCDHPDDTQVYRLAMCGAGDPQRCAEHWPYVRAADGESSNSRAWSIVSIDPGTGRFVAEGAAGSLRVWAYRDRPVYTYGGDRQPGDVNGDGTGEWRGQRNGLKAFWLRDDYLRGTL